MKDEKEQLCPKCQTGLDSLKLDSRAPMCPYLDYHNGTHCSKFRDLKETQGKSELCAGGDSIEGLRFQHTNRKIRFG